MVMTQSNKNYNVIEKQYVKLYKKSQYNITYEINYVIQIVRSHVDII